MSVKHNLEQWVAQLDYDDTCDITDRQVSDLIRNYAALEAKCAALAAENAGLKEYLAPVGLAVKGTPYTDAFLAEVRASAIEHAASERWGSGYIFDELNDFAAQLRKGGA